MVLDSHGKEFGVLNKMYFRAWRRRGLCRRGHARSGLLGRSRVWHLDHSRSCSRVVVSEVVQVVEVADHQLHDLRIVAGVFGIIRVRVCSFELDLAGLALLFRSAKNSRCYWALFPRTHFKRVCLQRGPEVLRMCADDQLVDREVVWAADDGAVGMFFAFKVASIEVSTCIN